MKDPSVGKLLPLLRTRLEQWLRPWADLSRGRGIDPTSGRFTESLSHFVRFLSYLVVFRFISLFFLLVAAAAGAARRAWPFRLARAPVTGQRSTAWPEPHGPNMFQNQRCELQ